MFNSTKAPGALTKGAMAAVAGLAALSGAMSAPVAASAQPAPAYGYDACQREATGRGVVGALLGGALGAAVGANAGARGNRQDGALLGGGLGAIGGAVIGNKSAACTGGYAPPPAPPAPAPRASYDPAPRDYGYGYDAPRYVPAPPPRYRPGRFDDDYAFGPRGQRLRVVEQAPGPDGCSLAESPIYMPDGRVQTRFVRVCRDSSGRYHVVD